MPSDPGAALPSRSAAAGYVLHVVALSALWGTSYMFIKIGVEDLPPIVLVAERVVVAALVLLPILVFQLGAGPAAHALRAAGRGVWVLGLTNATIPWLLLAWGEQHVDSGIAAIGNATIPLFVALLAIRFRPSERTVGLGIVGLFAGLAGVAVLVGVEPGGGRWAVLGTLAVVGSSIGFAASSLYAQIRYPDAPPLVLATAVTLTSAAVTVPLAVAFRPASAPGASAIGAAAALGVVGTAFAWVLLYRTLGRYGAARTSLNAYLLPVFALGYGAAILDERAGWGALLGLALILAGIAVSSGLVGRVRALAPAAGGVP